jgi:ubiquinone/menaquinone biosynthesis C-methylase UbiE
MLQYEGASSQELAAARTRIGRYRKISDSMEANYALHEQVVKPALALKPGDAVVEFGVGDGFHLKSYTSFRYRGFDTHPPSITRAKKNARFYGMSMSSIILMDKMMDKKRLPQDDDSMDAAFSVCTLHEHARYVEALEEMNRVLKPGGRLAVVERLCAIDEEPEAVERIKHEYENLLPIMERMGYVATPQLFQATYDGEFLAGDEIQTEGGCVAVEDPFDFLMVSGTKI